MSARALTLCLTGLLASLSAAVSAEAPAFAPGELLAPVIRLGPREKEQAGNILQQIPLEGVGLFPSTDELNAQNLLAQGFSPWSSLFFRDASARRHTFGPERPVPQGARVHLGPEHSRHLLGEEIIVEFTLTSAGGTLEGETGGDYRGGGLPARCIVVVRDPNGHPVPDQSGMFGFGGGFVQPLRLNPPDSHKQRLPLARYAKIEQPGRYTVSVHHDFGWTATAERPYPVATGSFELVLPTPEEAAVLVDRLCQPPANRDAQYTQEAQLGLLRHPIYVQPLSTAAARGRPLAIRGLQSIAHPTSTEALLELIEHPDYAVAKAAMTR